MSFAPTNGRLPRDLSRLTVRDLQRVLNYASTSDADWDRADAELRQRTDEDGR